jgi:low temperature requirement protein LtrA
MRRRGQRDSGRVSAVELFFDLIFVFAVTQLSHTLLENLTPAGALKTLLLFLAVWWLWIYTSWVTNWLDPEKPQVRIMLFVLMLGGLILSSSIPTAFAERGLIFGCLFAAMQVGRTLYVTYVMHGHRRGHFMTFLRASLWFMLSAAFWVWGGLSDANERVGLWVAAVAIEYVAPALYFWVPGLGRSSTESWDIDGDHMAERCGLFVIIALGESILVTGATFAGLAWDTTTVSAFLIAFLGSVAMWWIYFDTGARRASARIAHSEDPGRIARLAYTYLHLLIVGGIIVCAVADEIVLAHPEHVDDAGLAAILCGPLLYVIGNALFKWVMNDRVIPPLSHLVGIGLFLILAPFAFRQTFSALTLSALTTAILIVVAIWENIALRRPARGNTASEASVT